MAKNKIIVDNRHWGALDRQRKLELITKYLLNESGSKRSNLEIARLITKEEETSVYAEQVGIFIKTEKEELSRMFPGISLQAKRLHR